MDRWMDSEMHWWVDWLNQDVRNVVIHTEDGRMGGRASGQADRQIEQLRLILRLR